MNKEQQELLDGAYENYLEGGHIKWLNQMEVNTPDGKMNIPIPYTQEEFINICKTDSEFSQSWGLKIVSRKLTNPERYKLWFSNNYQTGMEYNESNMPDFSDSYYEPTPTKLITITYNDKTIESYEINGKLCYCGNPVDTSNPDCVTFNLCKEHQMDV